MINAIEILKSLSTDLTSQKNLERYFELTPDLLTVLGHPDGKIRDKLGWASLSRLIRHVDFPSSVRKSIAKLLLSPSYLFQDIGNSNSKAALKRSFSALTLADVLKGDIDSNSTFDSRYVAEISELLRSYLLKEKNICGYDDSFGWIHCFPHAGDALFHLALHPSITDEDLERNTTVILDIIEARGHEVFKWDEESRLGRPIAGAIHRLEAERVDKTLLKRFSRHFLFENPSRQNFLNTFRAVYLEMHWNLKSSLSQIELVGRVIRCERE